MGYSLGKPFPELAPDNPAPLGLVAGQRLLLSLLPHIEAAAQTTRTIADDDLSNWSQRLWLPSMQHELQYSQLCCSQALHTFAEKRDGYS